ncbi:MAG: hypothetical protein CL493_03985 [Actinobacteria bacterium]|nr:hypothetical protein [Actinomycetota bacterium]
MINLLRLFLKKYTPKLYNKSQPIRNYIYKTFFTKKNQLNVLKEFSEYSPNVSGDIDKKIDTTIYNIKNFSKSLLDLSSSNIEIKKFNTLSSDKTRKLGSLFYNYGSDKKTHEYDFLYEYIIEKFEKIDLLIEIGIGSNNTAVLSNMSERGKPGASLKAFRDYLSKSKIIGLEYDKSVLFFEDRIETYFYDQHSEESINEISKKYHKQVDILIDDGLHSIIANINTIKLAKNILKPDGYLIIEDIGFDSLKLFNVAFEFAAKDFSLELFTNNSCYAACLRRLN